MKSIRQKFLVRLSGLIKSDMTGEEINVKMRFRDFIFPSNPAELAISASTNYSSSPVFGSVSSVQNVSVNPAEIKGSGEFYGKKAQESCHYLQHLLRQKISGTLILPSASSFNAYLTDFNFTKNSNKNCILYSFVFVENCNSKSEYRDFCYTIAEDDENAFMIANRCNVSVNDIMKNNDFKTPFDIRKGERVVLR